MSSLAWLASNRWQPVLSQRRVFLPSLSRFSTSPRPLHALTTLTWASLELVMMKPTREKGLPVCHSI